MRNLLVGLLILVCVVCAGCAAKTPTQTTQVNTSAIAVASPEATPSLSSGSIAAAEIIFAQPDQPYTIDTLMIALQKRLPYPCTRTEWIGYSMVIPQIRINAPTPIILQINDDPDSVPEEIQELVANAERTFGAKTAAKIGACRVRLEVMAVEPNQAVVKEKSIVVTATTEMDPSIGPVRDVLKIVADTLHGYVFDDVHGKWQYAAR